jgi:hypothetical protein
VISDYGTDQILSNEIDWFVLVMLVFFCELIMIECFLMMIGIEKGELSIGSSDCRGILVYSTHVK